MRRTPLMGVLLAAPWPGRRRWPDTRSQDWAETPEAYFLTADELKEWKTIKTPEDRRVFQERYWLKRDPTPGRPATSSRNRSSPASRRPTSGSRWRTLRDRARRAGSF